MGTIQQNNNMIDGVSLRCLAILLSVGVLVVVCGVRGAGHDLRGAGCEMLSLILELQTCQSGICFAHVVTIH